LWGKIPNFCIFFAFPPTSEGDCGDENWVHGSKGFRFEIKKRGVLQNTGKWVEDC